MDPQKKIIKIVTATVTEMTEECRDGQQGLHLRFEGDEGNYHYWVRVGTLAYDEVGQVLAPNAQPGEDVDLVGRRSKLVLEARPWKQGRDWVEVVRLEPIGTADTQGA